MADQQWIRIPRKRPKTRIHNAINEPVEIGEASVTLIDLYDDQKIRRHA